MAGGLTATPKKRSKAKIPATTRKLVIERDGTYCRHCGHGPMLLTWRVSPKGKVKLYNDWETLGDKTIELDHIVPESKGGDNDPENLVVVCDDCNRRKWNRPVHTVLRAPAPISILPPPAPEQLMGQLPISPAELNRRLRSMGIY